MPTDQYGEYELDTGMDEPKVGRCNAPLKNWKVRYGEKRFCGHSPKGCPPPNAPNFDMDNADGFCRRHQYRENWNMRAEELLQHGAYTENREALMDKMGPWDKLLVYGLHESLMNESVWEYAPEHKSTTLDFSDVDDVPLEVDDNDCIELEYAYPTEKMDRAYHLFCAAVDTVKMMNVNTQIAADDMEVESTDHAQLTSPTESNPSQAWMTIDAKKEHHLNLAYSRLVKDRKELLAYGGVQTGTEADVENNSKVIDDFQTIAVDEDPHIEEGSGLTADQLEDDEDDTT